MEIGEFALSLIINLLSSVIYDYSKVGSLSFFQKRRVMSRVTDATAEVVEPLLPFLQREGISEEKQRRLIETCIEELRPLTQDPALFFQGSLNGDKLFRIIYKNRDLPQSITEDGLKDTYNILFPRIATIFCKIPEVVREWESEAWIDSFRRFDELVQLPGSPYRVHAMSGRPV